MVMKHANCALSIQHCKYDSTLFDCTRCFTGDDPLEALPRGCEGAKTVAELRARKQALDQGLESGSLAQTDSPTSDHSKS